MLNGPPPAAIYSLHPADAAARTAWEAAGGWVPPLDSIDDVVRLTPLTQSAREMLTAGSGAQQELLKHEREMGRDEGHEEGYDEGFRDAEREGEKELERAEETGYQHGFEAGKAEGTEAKAAAEYERGYAAGLAAGKRVA